MKLTSNILGILIITFFSVNASSLPSFPGAEGFGSTTPGGRGGKVIRVTNLNDSGPGSLRAALSASGKRIVVFAVEGQIKLRDQIEVKNPYLTLAGHTAPGEGVVISGARIRITTHDVIVRGLRMRAGDSASGDTPKSRDNLSIGGSARNIVVDSCSFTWSVDENLGIWGTINDVVFSNNIIAEALFDSIHIDEGKTSPAPHSMGFIVGGGQGARVSIIKNLFASNEFRNPMMKDYKQVEIINNLVSNYGAAHQGLKLGGGSHAASAHVIGNYYEDGQDTNRRESRPPFDLRSTIAGTKIFIKDNYMQYHAADSYHGGSSHVTNSSVFSGSGVKMLNSSQVKEYVLAKAGAKRAGKLDVVDQRIVNQIKNGTSKIIDSPREVGGFGVYNFGNSTVKDSDNDGMPDWYEAQNSLNPNQNDSSGDIDRDGYTNIEEYLNAALDGEVDSPVLADTPTRQPASEPSPAPEEPVEQPQTAESFMVEAEQMQLVAGFEVKSNSSASGNMWIQAKSEATALYQFDGAAGNYDLDLSYFDETDGESIMQLLINNQLVEEFVWNKSLGSHLANDTTRTSKSFKNISLQPGDVIELTGLPSGSEPLRTDCIVFTKLAEAAVKPLDLKVEAEALVLNGFRKKANSSASGGYWIQSSNQASADYVFGEASGSYDLTIAYFDENDGETLLEVLVNGQKVRQFRWNKQLGSRLANSKTHVTKTLSGITIKKGDKITLLATPDGGEPARIDYIEITN